MTRPVTIALAACWLFLLQPVSAQAAVSSPAGDMVSAEVVAPPETSPADPCEQLRLSIKALEYDRVKMAYENQALREEIRELKQTIDRIRFEVGSGRVGPSSY
jgi:hypothetical protein